ncbi:lysine--tRNA ligase [Candidatus Azambacteria bacterium]|nr:lysine--tRNA ligase [Candidatus Azambacteria bacterium]
MSDKEKELIGNRITKMHEGNWVEEVTDRILKVFPNENTYTCAAGISPSGIVHFGNFRDVITAYVFYKELQRRGKKTRLIFSWDDFDRLRKVPANVDPSFSKYIGMPLTAIPDPTGKTESYAKHFEIEFEGAMKDLGIELEYRYQTKEYTSGRYDEQMVHAMRSRKRIAEILLSFMSEKGKEEKNIDPEKFKEEFYPISVYSRFTGKDTTKILSYDGNSQITYLCLETKKEDTIDFKKEHRVKLAWKPDWAMRWKEEGVVLEPGGQDHASPGGSYDASSVMAKEIFDKEPPIFIGYQFVGIRGLGAKMSGSKGNAVSPAQLLEIYEPEMLKWIYLRKAPDQAFELAFDAEIYRQYDEFDRAVADFFGAKENVINIRSLAYVDGIDNEKFKNPIPFRQAVAYGQMMQWDKKKVSELLSKLELSYDDGSIEARLKKAKAWLEKYNPDEMIKLNNSVNKEYVSTMTDEAKILVRKLHEYLMSADTKNITAKELDEVVYGIPKREGIEDAELKKIQRVFFKDIYHLLVGKDTGPRLSTFIWAVDKKKLVDLLNI